jgi:RNA polymerase sigma-70 factor (ECF subfamily)
MSPITPAAAPDPAFERPSLDEFRRVHTAHAAEVWRALFRLGVDGAAIDDAAQDVFVTAFRRWHVLRDHTQRRAWLLGIARRIAFRHRRGDARRARRVSNAEPWTTPLADPEQHAAAVEAGTQLQQFLDELDDDKRAAFVFGELEELDRNALGAALGVNPNTAYSRLAAARRRFVERFDHTRAAAVLAVSLAELDRATPASQSWAALANALPAAPAVLPPIPPPGALGKLLLTLAGTAAIATTAIATRPTVRPDVASAPVAATPRPAARVDVAPAELAAVAPAARARSTSPTTVVAATKSSERPRSGARTPTRGAIVPGDEGDPDPQTVSGVDGEVAVLHAARRAIGRGDTSAARSWLDVHRRRWPDGGEMASVRDSIERQMINAGAGGDDRP